MVTSINILSTGEEYVLRMNQKCFNTNPFSNVLTIEIDGNDEILDIEILNTSDQLVFKGENDELNKYSNRGISKRYLLLKI